MNRRDDKSLSKYWDVKLLQWHERAVDQLYGRDVVLVGGAASADKIRFTEADQRRFFVVQLNGHIYRRYVTQHCDWLVCRPEAVTLDDYAELPKAVRQAMSLISVPVNDPGFFKWAAHCDTLIPFHDTAHAARNPWHFSLEWCNAFANELRTAPLTGMLALKMILMFPVRSVRLVGFDFYDGPDGEQKTMIGCHSLDRNREWLIRQWHCDYRIEFDGTLIKSLRLDPARRGLLPPFPQ